MLSGTIGFVVAFALCAAVNQLPMPTRFSGMVLTPAAGLAAIAALILVGVITSTYPARRAAQLPPVDALRFEAQ
jgi:ABC-type antimicrobial peptide transport system permease subunit